MIKIILISFFYFSKLGLSKDLFPPPKRTGFQILKEISNSKSIVKRVKKGEIISVSQVEDQKIKDIKTQILTLYSAALHPKSCQFALKKLSLYENYKDYIGIIKESYYDEQTKRIGLSIESSLLPFHMKMDFKMARMEKPGTYPFSFDKGFLKSLKGQISIHEEKSQCLFLLTAKFKGPDTGINSIILGFFTETAINLGLTNLIRISKTY